MFGLLLELVQLSQEGDVQNNPAKHFANELCLDLLYLLRRYSKRQCSQVSKSSSISCLRTLSSLLALENYVGEALDGSHSDDIRDASARQSQPKEKIDPNYVCPVHKIPAVRRRCASGTNKDRRFYVCGMERGQRCKYFVWADGAIGKPEDKKRDRSPIYNIFHGHLWSESAEVGLSLQERLCQVLENLLLDGEDNEPASSLSVSKKKDRLNASQVYIRNCTRLTQVRHNQL